ncbi:hypothetical protein CBM2633_B10615 [Cupriavidus taiwanensis]|uniref:Uncharacterized protein n=1 Tax=Cupriavidus taiwanensis TaxID=164546 RepID=A0A375E8F2_9BURK|nr:hypothetical protein CBM2604_B130237 [Cupriavidus taiwanensis]SOZ31279.1 hypothetical protein CBM2609_B120238 [Cupriavidus taiwanensis]SOZ47356.1 hypothetical protein CBM2610_B100238 [Cupriavidus taiwanensis]SOZ66593.1 hypothetical protein CBM2614_B200301 [Cupriavidus taiwanensis]SOZ67389.1 hypothetical protein CBM2615_B190300 [Cupriavidus taiwanensis]
MAPMARIASGGRFPNMPMAQDSPWMLWSDGFEEVSDQGGHAGMHRHGGCPVVGGR